MFEERLKQISWLCILNESQPEKKNIGHYYDLNATEEADRKGLMKETDRRSFFLGMDCQWRVRMPPRRLGKWEAEAKELWSRIWGSFCNTWVLSPYLAGEDVFSGRLMTNGIWVLEVLLTAILVQLLILQMKRGKPVKLLGSALSTAPPTPTMIRNYICKAGWWDEQQTWHSCAYCAIV